jgi:hypothetical protein
MLCEEPKWIVVHRMRQDDLLGIPREGFWVDFLVYRNMTCFTQDVLVPAKDEIEAYQRFKRHMGIRYGITDIRWQIGANNETTEV